MGPSPCVSDCWQTEEKEHTRGVPVIPVFPEVF